MVDDMLIKSSVYSEIFWYFIDHLKNKIEKNEQFEIQKVMIILYNWSCHKSKMIEQKLKILRYKIMFLPLYSQSLIPIELVFGYLKITIKS